MSEFKAVILAGGSGERFWPLSTPERPKQFLNVFGGESLIRQAFTRLSGLVRPEDIFVVTSAALVDATRRELPELPRGNVVGEPMRRDTGAAVALGVAVAGDGTLGFFPADQMVAKPKACRRAVSRAIATAERRDTIVTIGVRPTYPATSFGYVDPKRGTFVEKPDARKAARYLRRGFLWNAGMFIARSRVFRDAFAAHAPSLLPLLSSGGSRHLRSVYEPLPRISFDYAVMEKLPRVAVVKGDFGWDDVGSYGAYDRYVPHDSRGNVREGPCTVVEADGNICVARSARISLLGVT
ncbi:MAG: mannose-1-phosphate guanylyltransferase, partial [Kiritimatiellae bacterium]|nr:mannose-1-phosphate guanylyltransferase [Kiritimatiellia bacterium]